MRPSELCCIVLSAAGLVGCGPSTRVLEAWRTTTVIVMDPAQVTLRGGGEPRVLPGRVEPGPVVAQEVTLADAAFPTGQGSSAHYVVRARRAANGEISVAWEASALLNGEYHQLVPFAEYKGSHWTVDLRARGDDNFADGCMLSDLSDDAPTTDESGRAIAVARRRCMFTSLEWKNAPVARIPACTELLPQWARGILVGYNVFTHIGPCTNGLADWRRAVVAIDVVLETPWSNLADVTQRLHLKSRSDAVDPVTVQVLYTRSQAAAPKVPSSVTQ